jgi:hypothetical protein
MAGYRDRLDGEIFGEQHKPTRIQWVFIVAAMLAGFAILIGAIAQDSSSAPSWLKRLDFGIAPLGFVQFMIGWTFIARARANAEGERYSPRALRGYALIFFLLGALIIGIGLYSHFQGAR